MTLDLLPNMIPFRALAKPNSNAFQAPRGSPRLAHSHFSLPEEETVKVQQHFIATAHNWNVVGQRKQMVVGNMYIRL